MSFSGILEILKILLLGTLCIYFIQKIDGLNPDVSTTPYPITKMEYQAWQKARIKPATASIHYVRRSGVWFIVFTVKGADGDRDLILESRVTGEW